jgi:hypothetical protein
VISHNFIAAKLTASINLSKFPNIASYDTYFLFAWKLKGTSVSSNILSAAMLDAGESKANLCNQHPF